MRGGLLFLAFSLFTGEAFCQDPRFIRENLEFELDSVYFTVQGEYTFFNPSPDSLKLPVTYPVPSAGEGPPFDTIIVMDLASLPAGQPYASFIPVRIKDTLAFFTVLLPPRAEKSVHIYYRQKHPPGKARYILTTTSTWGRPLDFARYTLFDKHHLGITWFSIPYDQKKEMGSGVLYTWERRNFLPACDFEIKFPGR